MRYHHIPLLLVMPLMLLACGGPKEKIGSTDTKGKTRVAAFHVAAETPPTSGHFMPDYNARLPDPVVNKDWPMAGYNAGHNPQNLAYTAKPAVVWTASIGEGSGHTGTVLSQPVVAGGRVYTLDAVGMVSCFAATDGERLWQHEVGAGDGGGLAGGGLATDGTAVYVATGSGTVVALSTKDGHMIWRRALQNPLRSAPTLSGGRLFVTSIDNNVSALDKQTGQILWHYRGVAENTTLMGTSSPAVADSGVIVGTSAGDIINLRPENGRLLWGVSLASSSAANSMLAISDVRGLPVVDRGAVVAISHAGRMGMIDARTGDLRWEIAVGGQQTPLVIGEAVYVVDANNQLKALSRDRGQTIWARQLQRYEDDEDATSSPLLWAGPVMADTTLWLVNSRGDVVGVSARDGLQNALVPLDEPLFMSPVLAERTMYVVTDDGTLMALR